MELVILFHVNCIKKKTTDAARRKTASEIIWVSVPSIVEKMLNVLIHDTKPDREIVVRISFASARGVKDKPEKALISYELYAAERW